MNVKPLEDFYEIVAELGRKFRPYRYDVSASDEEVLAQKLKRLTTEFSALYETLTGEPSSTFEYEPDGSAVMSESTPADHVERTVNDDTLPYRTFRHRDNPQRYNQVLGILSTLKNADQLLRVSTILSTQQPTKTYPDERPNDPATSDTAKNQLSMMLYMRNRGWLHRFTSGTKDVYAGLSELSHLNRLLWASYGKRDIEAQPPVSSMPASASMSSLKLLQPVSDPTVSSSNNGDSNGGSNGNSSGDSGDDGSSDAKFDTSAGAESTANSATAAEPLANGLQDATVNAFDALFEPLHVVDYSPKELVVAVQVEKLVAVYQELINSQIQKVRQDLTRSAAELKAEKLRHKMLLNEIARARATLEDPLGENTEELWQQLQQVETAEELTTDLFAAQLDNRDLPPKLTKRQRNALRENEAYNRFLVGTYYDRERRFLEYLVAQLKALREGKRVFKMPRLQEFNTVERFKDRNYYNAPINAYLRHRNRILNQLYRRQKLQK